MKPFKERLRKLGIFSDEMCRIYKKYKENKFFVWLVNKDLGVMCKLGLHYCITHKLVQFKIWIKGGLALLLIVISLNMFGQDNRFEAFFKEADIAFYSDSNDTMPIFTILAINDDSTIITFAGREYVQKDTRVGIDWDKLCNAVDSILNVTCLDVSGNSKTLQYGTTELDVIIDDKSIILSDIQEYIEICKTDSIAYGCTIIKGKLGEMYMPIEPTFKGFYEYLIKNK